MPYDPKIHHRHSVRLPHWDYSSAWWYFITICTDGRQCLFGEIINHEMHLNELGKIVKDEWLKTPSIRKEIELDHYIIMPNHLHGIVIIKETQESCIGKENISIEADATVGTHGRASLQRSPRSLGSLVAGFKSAATKRINLMRNMEGVRVWQGRFYDHLIRDDADLQRIRQYIADNPLQWELDEENPERISTKSMRATP